MLLRTFLASTFLLLAMMATGNDMMSQMPGMMNGRMMGLATIWIGLILLLIVAAIVWIGRSAGRRGGSERHKAA